MCEDSRFAVTNEDLDAVDQDAELLGANEEYAPPRCELCYMPAKISTQRLDGDVEKNPYIDLCDHCDRRYQQEFAQ